MENHLSFSFLLHNTVPLFGLRLTLLLRTIFHAMNLYIKSSKVCMAVCWVAVHVHTCECVLSGHICTGSVVEDGTWLCMEREWKAKGTAETRCSAWYKEMAFPWRLVECWNRLPRCHLRLWELSEPDWETALSNLVWPCTKCFDGSLFQPISSHNLMISWP